MRIPASLRPKTVAPGHSRAPAVQPKRWPAISPISQATEAALQPMLDDGVPQVMVHSAGTHDDVPMAGMTERQWRSVIDVSLNGFYAVSRPSAVADDGDTLGADHRDLLGLGDHGQSRTGQLRRCQGWADRRGAGVVAGGRQPRHHGECGRAGDHRFAVRSLP